MANTPGGLGATEYAAVEFLGRAAGIDPEVALASVLLARGAHYLCSLVFGGIVTFSGTGRGLADADHATRELVPFEFRSGPRPGCNAAH